jgi:hypothetical protein
VVNTTGNARRRRLRGLRGERPESGDQHIGLGCNKLRRQRPQTLRMPFRRSIVDDHVRALAVAELVEPLEQRLHQRLVLSGDQGEIADAVRLPARLLRARRKRPYRRATDQRDEVPPPHFKHWPSPAPGVTTSSQRTHAAGLPHAQPCHKSGQKVPEAGLNCSESKWPLAAPPLRA